MSTDPGGGSDPASITVAGLADEFDRALPGAPGRPELAAALLARWSEPHRRYHDRRHLAEVLTMIDRWAEPDHDRPLVRLAAWYHDAVHTGTAGDDEEASARLAETELGPVLGAVRAGEVGRLVRLTAGHRVGADDPNGRLLCDADLAVLASVPERYAEYAADVRREYAHVPDAAFAAGRARVLRSLLEAPLYGTPRGRAAEARARANLAAELERLDAGKLSPPGPERSGRSGPSGSDGSG